ncbi:MAG: bifunctional folylpolyglutamate synthase/dihydrofolate synthase, partial [Clostridia bacterium]|nr:bifunctional folylpolyglutamate synthase/dihydrofolate synthase [Clostridia bacterium]
MHEKCDIVVLETGLGGRLDTTNIVKNPMLCIISAIGLDHMSILGDTIEKIAFEKAGIIKQNVPVAVHRCMPRGALRVIEQRCADMGSSICNSGAEPAQNIQATV